MTISCRKKENKDYKRVTLDIVSADEYSKENRECFLYVKISD